MRTMRGDRRGTLHPDSPVPGLVCHVDMLLEEFDLLPGPVALDLADERSRQRSRALHQLRVLGVQDSSELQVQAVVLQWCRQNGG